MAEMETDKKVLSFSPFTIKLKMTDEKLFEIKIRKNLLIDLYTVYNFA